MRLLARPPDEIHGTAVRGCGANGRSVEIPPPTDHCCDRGRLAGFSQLEDHAVALGNMKVSRFVEPFLPEACPSPPPLPLLLPTPTVGRCDD